jgi:hypothetical protein
MCRVLPIAVFFVAIAAEVFPFRGSLRVNPDNLAGQIEHALAMITLKLAWLRLVILRAVHPGHYTEVWPAVKSSSFSPERFSFCLLRNQIL